MDEEEIQSEITYYQSNKGGRKLLYKGYIYTRNRERGETSYWVCEQRSVCHGRLIVTNGIVAKENEHTHAPDTSSAKVQMALSGMKESVTDSRETTSAVINKHIERLDKDSRHELPSDEAMRKRLQRKRRKDQPPLPKTLLDVVIEGE